MDNAMIYNDSTYEFEIKITQDEGVLRVSPIIIQWVFAFLLKLSINSSIFTDIFLDGILEMFALQKSTMAETNSDLSKTIKT